MINCKHLKTTIVGEGVEIATEKYYYIHECNECKIKIKEFVN